MRRYLAITSVLMAGMLISTPLGIPPLQQSAITSTLDSAPPTLTGATRTDRIVETTLSDLYSFPQWIQQEKKLIEETTRIDVLSPLVHLIKENYWVFLPFVGIVADVYSKKRPAHSKLYPQNKD